MKKSAAFLSDPAFTPASSKTVSAIFFAVSAVISGLALHILSDVKNSRNIPLTARFHDCDDTLALMAPPYIAVFGLPVSSLFTQLGGTVWITWKSTYKFFFIF